MNIKTLSSELSQKITKEILEKELTLYNETNFKEATTIALGIDYKTCILVGEKLSKTIILEKTNKISSTSGYLVPTEIATAHLGAEKIVSKIYNSNKFIKLNNNAKSLKNLSNPTSRLSPRRPQTPPEPHSSPQLYGTPNYYLGKPEWDYWALAPLQTVDRIYINPEYIPNIEKLKPIFLGWQVSLSAESSIRITAKTGELDRLIVEQFLILNNIDNNRLRIVTNMKRRQLSSLPVNFLKELVTANADYLTKKAIGSYNSRLRMITSGEKDEIKSLVIEWILELVESFDAEKGVPFKAWITMRLPQKIQDYTRSQSSRVLSEFKMKRNEIIDMYSQQGNSQISKIEIASLMGLTVKQYEKKILSLQQLENVEYPAGLSYENPNGDSQTIEIAALNPSALEIVEKRETHQELIAALISIAEKADLGKEVRKLFLEDNSIREFQEGEVEEVWKNEINVAALKSKTESISIHSATSSSTFSSTSRVSKNKELTLTGLRAIYLIYWLEMKPAEAATKIGVSRPLMNRGIALVMEEVKKSVLN